MAHNNNRLLWITCPSCSHRAEHAVPAIYRLVAQECNHCGELLEVPDDAHCLFCAYGDEGCGLNEP